MIASVFVKRKSGILTVEAAFVLPIFVYSIIALLYFVQIVMIQEKIQLAMSQAAQIVSQYGYVYKDILENPEEEGKNQGILTSFLKGILLKKEFFKYLNENEINSSFILGGTDGISFLHSSFMKKDKDIDIVIEYRMKIPVPFFSIPNYKMVQRIRTRAFVGTTAFGEKSEEVTEENGEAGKLVYITVNGKVYHEKEECSHISIKIRSISYEDVSGERNEWGGKYSACERCFGNSKPEQGSLIYLTEDGDRYHKSYQCGGLKRTIITISKDKINGRQPCKRCGNKE